MTQSEDELRLAKLGYKQGLKRQFSALQTFGLVLTNASTLIGVIPLFSQAMNLGGPVAFTWGWLITGSFVCCIGLSLAEICSTYPTAGGLYYYAAKLGGPKYGPVSAWFTAWFNILGQIAGCSGSVYAGATYFAIFLSIVFPSVTIVPTTVFTIFIVMMVLIGLLNCVGGLALKGSSYIATFIHTIGVLFIVITLFATSQVKQSPSFVFTQFIDGTGWTNVQGASPFFVCMLGLLPSAWTLIGYDSSAHLSEETENAHIAGPRAIMFTIATSITIGWMLILSFLFNTNDLATQQAGTYGALYALPAQIFYDAAGAPLACVFILIIALAGFLTGIGTVAANSRCLYALARDGGLPFSKVLTVLDKNTGMPLRLVWVSTFFVSLLAVPALFSTVVLTAISGISIIGFTVSYAIPIYIRITIGADKFHQSEFNLGPYSKTIGWIGVLWTCLVVVIFQFPNAAPAFPITVENFNFVPVVVASLICFTGGWWVLDARKWFKGPVAEIPIEPENTSQKIIVVS
ncbi:amino acid/polyamine transporter I [Globomyces pollinis-pini]|nr:amino acid/polyamine transporter I [Globomyces pollinis-pini]